MRYLDFELKIEREGEHYKARIIRSPIGEASSSFSLPFSDLELENLVLKMTRLRSSSRKLDSPETAAATEFGGRLFNAVFTGEVYSSFRSSLREARQAEDTGLRLKLHLQEVAELADLPWEFLRDIPSKRFLSQSVQTPIVRYVEMAEEVKSLTVQLPLRLLVAISSPVDPRYRPLDVPQEKAKLEEALDPLKKQGKVVLRWLENATLPALQRLLRGNEKFHVFHFIGHGGFDKKREQGVLVLEDERKFGWEAEADRIATILHDHTSLRLAVLNSCEGARNSRSDPFAGVAATLVQQGIPAVVAMQFEISDRAAIVFAGEFYSALAGGLPVDAAAAEARKGILAIPNDVEWGTPVLYMRSPDGNIFTLARPPEVQADIADDLEERTGGLEIAAQQRGENDRHQARDQPSRLGETDNSEQPIEVSETPKRALGENWWRRAGKWRRRLSVASVTLVLLLTIAFLVSNYLLKESEEYVDCKVVQVQAEAGRTNEEIATAIGSTEAAVASCGIKTALNLPVICPGVHWEKTHGWSNEQIMKQESLADEGDIAACEQWVQQQPKGYVPPPVTR